ncbi:Rho-related BTB domain-containing protein 3 isoform X2 [Aix galericulata]|nr:Rho-related BTB domain-containing protein 3 isoform X2 [Aix galericulata]
MPKTNLKAPERMQQSTEDLFLWGEQRCSGILLGMGSLKQHQCYPGVLDIFDSDWYTSRSLIGGADIIVIKYSVNDKTSFQEIKDSYVPMIKKALNHCSIPVIISAIGARKNLPCTCPLCTSDRGSCVTTSEGLQLAKEFGATYLELHALNDFYIQKYFGGVLEYFMIQSLNQKSSEKMKKRKKNQKRHRTSSLTFAEKLPILKGEASHYDSDLHNLLFCCQCTDVAFYSEDFSKVMEAHKVILCSVSQVFMLLFNVKSPADVHDSSVVRTAQSLFAVDTMAGLPVPRGSAEPSPPARVIVKDSVFCSCLLDILHFIYSGACQWERLEEDIKKKLKDSEKTEHVLEKVKCILKTPGKLNNLRDGSSHQIKQLYNTSLRLFFNTPVLADVIFTIQGATVPAHRAVLVARCEVMAAMFNGNYLEANSVLVPVYGVSKDTFLSFLEYLYTDSCCPASILQAMSLLICAEMYQVMRLQHICELYIITQLQSMSSRELATTSLSIVSLLKKAKFHNSDCLSTWLLHFIATNYLIFSQKPEFQDLSVEERNFVEMHRWPSNMYLKQLAEYRNYIHSQKCHCAVMAAERPQCLDGETQTSQCQAMGFAQVPASPNSESIRHLGLKGRSSKARHCTTRKAITGALHHRQNSTMSRVISSDRLLVGCFAQQLPSEASFAIDHRLQFCKMHPPAVALTYLWTVPHCSLKLDLASSGPGYLCTSIPSSVETEDQGQPTAASPPVLHQLLPLSVLSAFLCTPQAQMLGPTLLSATLLSTEVACPKPWCSMQQHPGELLIQILQIRKSSNAGCPNKHTRNLDRNKRYRSISKEGNHWVAKRADQGEDLSGKQTS